MHVGISCLCYRVFPGGELTGRAFLETGDTEVDIQLSASRFELRVRGKVVYEDKDTVRRQDERKEEKAGNNL